MHFFCLKLSKKWFAVSVLQIVPQVHEFFIYFLSVTRFRCGHNFVFENIFIFYFAVFRSGESVNHIYNLIWPKDFCKNNLQFIVLLNNFIIDYCGTGISACVEISRPMSWVKSIFGWNVRRCIKFKTTFFVLIFHSSLKLLLGQTVVPELKLPFFFNLPWVSYMSTLG